MVVGPLPNFDIHIERIIGDSPNRADAAGTVRVELPKKEWERQKACYTEVMPKLLKRPGRKAAATRGTVARANPRSEDEALNRICDQRLNEPRYPIDKLLKKMGYDLER